MSDLLPENADARFKANAGDESVIPAGCYCYTGQGLTHPADGGPPRMEVKECPYWARNPEKPEQINGYCAYLGEGDWQDDGPSLLWDMVKECGINTEDPDTPEEEAS